MFTNTDIDGLIIIQPKMFGDERGYFFEAYNQTLFQLNGIQNTFVQDNQSKSSFGVIRGLHYQLPPFAQAKLVRVLQGSILDVAVDIRKDSPTFGQHFSIELSSKNNLQLFIPPGFAHGFSVLGDTAIVQYKCDQFYNKESEAGIRWNDEQLKIDWKIDASEAVVSGKDLELPSFEQCINTFQY